MKIFYVDKVHHASDGFLHPLMDLSKDNPKTADFSPKPAFIFR